MITVDAYRRLNLHLAALRADIDELLAAEARGAIPTAAARRCLDDVADRLNARAAAVRVGSLSARGAFAERFIAPR